MGIKINSRTKLKESLKLLNHINSFMFEQEYDELKNYNSFQKDALRKASSAISKVISNG